jgi:hypothetical protein
MREPFGNGRDLLQRSQYGYGGRGTRMAPVPQPRVTAAVNYQETPTPSFSVEGRPPSASTLSPLLRVRHGSVFGMSYFFAA